MNGEIPDGIISGYGPPILPVEVEERIIDVIAARAQHSDDTAHDSTSWMRTLLSCSLTCRAWVPRCRRHFFKVVYISSIDSLNRLANHVSSDPFFVPSHVLELKVHSSDVPSNDKNAVTPFHHLVPHYLASKLPEVIYLEFIQADGSNPAHIFHPSFFCQASHFRNVSELWISNYRFPCLADLRRFLAALRALTKVFLTDVLWQNDSAPPTQIPRSTKWKLAHMELYNCQLLSSAFYFWIVPRREVTGTRDHRVPDDDFHPGLFLRDTLIMGQCLQLIRQPDGNGENFELEWLLVSGLGPCEPSICQSIRAPFEVLNTKQGS